MGCYFEEHPNKDLFKALANSFFNSIQENVQELVLSLLSKQSIENFLQTCKLNEYDKVIEIKNKNLDHIHIQHYFPFDPYYLLQSKQIIEPIQITRQKNPSRFQNFDYLQKTLTSEDTQCCLQDKIVKKIKINF